MNTILTEQEYKIVIAKIKTLLNSSAEDVPEIKKLSAAAIAYEQIKYDFTNPILHQASYMLPE